VCSSDLTLCVPETDPLCIDNELLNELKTSGLYNEEKDPKKAIKDADIVYTDTWVNMEVFLDPKFEDEKNRRIKLLMPYQVNKKLLEGSNALIMHDLPAHREYEIDGYAMTCPNSIIFDQAENRLHSQKAVLLTLIK
jgi:ornithine carbamoyltransferase